MARLIDADALIDWYRPYGQIDEPIFFETLVSDLRDFPTVDAVPVVHGRWEDAGFGLVYKCSECGHSEDVRLSNYCPNCGAKMDGGN